MTFDGKAFGAEIVGVVKDYVAASLSPVVARLDALEKQIAALPKPKEIDEDAIVARARGASAEEVAIWAKQLEEAIAKAQTSAELPDVAGMIEEAISALPKVPELPDIPEIVAEAVANIPKPKDGKDADPEKIAAMVKAEAERILAGWERPKGVTLDDVVPVIADAVQKAVSAIPKPQDGVGVAGAIIDRDGELALTLTSGSVVKLGRVVGKDAAPPKEIDMVAVEQMIAEKVAEIPAPLDGVGFDDLDLEFREDAAYFVFTRGDIVKEARLPIPVYRGVFRDEGTTYYKGNTVTWGGSTWISEVDEPKGKPDTAGSGWRLAVKKGRDAKAREPVKQ